MIQFLYGSEYVHVYHIGEYSCTLKPESSNDIEYTKKWVKRFPGMSFKQLKTHVIQTLMESNDMQGAEEAAYKITNKAYR